VRRLGALFASLELIGLGAWIGGMLVLGGMVAPAVFGKLGPDSGGEIMSGVFRQFNGAFVYACIVLSIVGFLGKFFLNRLPGKARWIEATMLAVMTLVGLYVGAIMGPRMQELREIRMKDPSNGTAIAEFDRDHHLSVQLFSVNLFLGVAALALNGREISLRGK